MPFKSNVDLMDHLELKLKPVTHGANLAMLHESPQIRACVGHTLDIFFDIFGTHVRHFFNCACEDICYTY